MAVRPVHLNTIEARSKGVFCGGGVRSNETLDFFYGERAWNCSVFPSGDRDG
jgi:hypothetical protein